VSPQNPRWPAFFLLFVLPAGAQPMLRLKTRAWTPDPDSLVLLRRRDSLRMHRILQFALPPSGSQIRDLAERGARVLEFVPDTALLVSAPDDFFRDSIASLPVLLFDSEKISPLLQVILSEQSRVPVVVEFHSDVNVDDARSIVTEEGLAIRDHPDLQPSHLLVEGSLEGVQRLADWDEVAYVFPAAPDLETLAPAKACAGAITDLGPVGQYVSKVGDGWDGPGRNAASLTYSLQKLTDKLPPSDVEREIARALAEWSTHVHVSFTLGGASASPRNLDFLFGTRSHGDAFPFDGRGRVLAHTFYPAPPNPEPIAGDLHLDEEEDWKIGADTDVYSVILHELGHALGLGHSDLPTAVMYPYYRRATKLATDDIAAIQDLYAARDSGGSPAPPQPLTLTILDPAASPFTTAAAQIDIAGATGGGSGDIQLRWSSDRGPSGIGPGTRQWRISSIPLGTGINDITVTASDLAAARVSRSVSVIRQPSAPQPPTVRITSPSGSSYTTRATSLMLAGTATGASLTRVVWSSSTGGEGQAQGLANWTAGPIPLRPGSNRILATAQDASGATASAGVDVIQRADTSPDQTAPSITITKPASSNVITAASGIVLRGTAADDSGVTVVTWSSNIGAGGTAFGTTSWSTSAIPLLRGINVIVIRVRDSAGNVGWRSLVATRL